MSEVKQENMCIEEFTSYRNRTAANLFPFEVVFKSNKLICILIQNIYSPTTGILLDPS